MDLSTETEAGQRNRAAIKILVGLVLVGAVIGLLAGLLGATALRGIGIKQTDDPVAVAPSAAKTTAPTATPTPTPTPSPTKSEPTQEPEKILDAEPTSVDPGQRITLRGQLPGLSSDAVLQVQRKEQGGSWEDFPVTARTESDGDFSTWVITSRTGRAKFRLVNLDEDMKTPPVTVQIG